MDDASKIEKHLLVQSKNFDSFNDTSIYTMHWNLRQRDRNTVARKIIICGLSLAFLLLALIILRAFGKSFLCDNSYLNSNWNEIHAEFDSPFRLNSQGSSDIALELKTPLPHPKPSSEVCYDVPEELRFDCFPLSGASEDKCSERGCCWKSTISSSPDLGVPFCYYPSNYGLYKWDNISQNERGVAGNLVLKYSSGYVDDILNLGVEAFFETNYRLRIKIYDRENRRYEPPVPVTEPKDFVEELSTEYEFKIDPKKTGFVVKRRATGEIIFDTTTGGFTFANQFLQISSLLPSPYLYGIGEQQDTLLHSTNWKQFSLFAHDGVPADHMNLYGSHPFYLVMENNGMSHGVFLKNSDPMDIIIQPAPAITFRTIGGIFDFYIFLGPKPGDVVSQYTELIGRPFMPPFWSLGYHQCRFGYNTLNRTKEIMGRTRDAGIPFDVQWVDIDYMDKRRDFTYDKDNYFGLPDFVKALQLVGMHFIPIMDPGISNADSNGAYPPYDEGLEMNVFIQKNKNSAEPFEGKVWNPVSTVWPDFTHPNATEYWINQIRRFVEEVPIDGLWIDMNEPANFYNGAKEGCPDNSLENPPYTPRVVDGHLQHKTLCMSAQQYAGAHYDVHNLYGFTETIATNFALTEVLKRRPFIISRSTYPGQGHFGGHWTGDVRSDWGDMKKSISAILNFNMFGIPMVGADICGFVQNTTADLCTRWMELGAFYPFSRNHNSDDTIDQDPVALGPDVVEAAKNSLLIRYSLLPYLYTLFWRANQYGETVARPLFFEFPDDRSTYGIDVQFLWGSSLMIIPVLDPLEQVVTAYFPKGLWYDYETFKIVSEGEEIMDLESPSGKIRLAIRGGSIIPTQSPNVTTARTRLSPFELIAALDEEQKACGSLYWDDGISIDSFMSGKYNYLEFSSSGSALEISPKKIGYFDEHLKLGSVRILGIQSDVVNVSLNGGKVDFTYSKPDKVLIVDNLSANMSDGITISWH
ncbi:lysosomal alpha-glucosidase-like [Artemia franciscana]|uniref:lysosomal alpha-glucosidase-like n=1 Tax=Artemia franciscana TaxID=6661 RepID=UPI0032D9E01E